MYSAYVYCEYIVMYTIIRFGIRVSSEKYFEREKENVELESIYILTQI